MKKMSLLGLAAALLVQACGGPSAATETPDKDFSYGELPRSRFNQLAVREGIPVHWFVDRDEDGSVDPDEIRALRFYDTTGNWTSSAGGELSFTSDFSEAYARLVAANNMATTDPRLTAVWNELEMTSPTLVHNDLTHLPQVHRDFAAKMLEVGALVDVIYAKQQGAAELADQVAGDAASRSLFRRNWGPRCVGKNTQDVPECSAIEGAPAQRVGIYPAGLQTQEGFCDMLAEHEDTSALLDSFTVVREAEDGLVAVPYNEAYAAESRAVAESLREAAELISADPAETALVEYLRRAADAFLDNDWFDADAAWAAMTAENSRWYIRVGPDEVYWDPCSRKAAYHLTLSLIDPSSLEWRDRLAPVQDEMEASLAALVDTYDARSIEFHLPAFIQIVANFGDDRDPFGATSGQSLPNWGPVAEASNGRTVVMSTLFTDPDSLAQSAASASALFDEASFAHYASEPQSGPMSTVLHEAMHNLGPAQGYTYEGDQSAEEVFGGSMASMLEELKAQTGALFLVELLKERGLLNDETANEVYMDSIAWAFGHISRGMWTASGRRKAYSQLAAIQIGYFMDHGAIGWDPQAVPASGNGQGAFNVNLERFPEVARQLMIEVMSFKSTGDAEAALALTNRYVGEYNGSGAFAASQADVVVPHEHIVRAYRDIPRPTLVYSIEL